MPKVPWEACPAPFPRARGESASFRCFPAFQIPSPLPPPRIRPAEDPHAGESLSRVAPCPDLPSVIVKLEENIEKRFDAVRTREHDPIIDVRVLHQLCEFAQIAR